MTNMSILQTHTSTTRQQLNAVTQRSYKYAYLQKHQNYILFMSTHATLSLGKRDSDKPKFVGKFREGERNR